jgi:hypothetical protein
MDVNDNRIFGVCKNKEDRLRILRFVIAKLVIDVLQLFYCK